MKTADLIGGRLVLGILAIVLSGSVAALSEENQTPSDLTDTNRPPDIATNSITVGTQPAEIEPDSAYGELIRLVLAGVDQNVILTYIENSLRFFNLDADRIIYLSDLGAPSGIIEAAMQHDKQLLQEGISPSVEDIDAVTNPPPEVTADYLYDTLSPYGAWIYIEGYGRCWRPAVVAYHAGWQPYCDNGRWVYTDYGWYWMSDYSWGWAAFHYGRWFRHAGYGWCWWPDTVWSPSWVCWRYDRDYCGWAPLPPFTSCRSGTGILYRGTRVSVGFNFGLDLDCYTFIATRNLCDPQPRRHGIDQSEAKRIFDRTKVLSAMDYDLRKKSVVNGGISPNIVSTLSRQDITPVTVRHAGRRTGNNNRPEQLNLDTRTLVVSRPAHAVPQTHPSPAGRSSASQTHSRQSPETYVAAAGRNSHTPEPEAVRPPQGRVQQAKPPATRPPTSEPQTRQQRVTPPPVGTTPQRPANNGHPASPQQGGNSPSVQQGNRSTDAASGQKQGNSRNTRPTPPPAGKSNGAAQGNRQSAQGRPAVAQGSQ